MKPCSLLLLLACLLLPLAGCNNPTSPPASTSEIKLTETSTSTVGSPVTKYVITGTAKNQGITIARDVTIIARSGSSYIRRLTSPSDIAAGSTATWEVTMTASSKPYIYVTWH